MEQVFDGHNDVLLRLWLNAKAGGDPVREFTDGTFSGHIDGPRAKAGGLTGGLCAIFVPSGKLVLEKPDKSGRYHTPLSEPLDRQISLDIAIEQAAIAWRLHNHNAWSLCRSTTDIDSAVAKGSFAAVLHMEGCEPLDRELAALELFYAAGLRSLGPVWSRNNIFGHGVPFAYPHGPDAGPGLTDAGFDLIRACNQLGILIDLSHLTEKGFWDVAKSTEQPLVASHSNAHALTPVARNLTDRQLDAIRESNGLVGLNFAVTMLRPDGGDNVTTPLENMVRHVDYMVERMGIKCVAIGSDFDGASIPAAIGNAEGLPVFVDALKRAGYANSELAMICRENWFRILRWAWKEEAPD
ncbi:MAG: dipeptidase [Rhizobiaceae bacterium]|nr:dipeptidase [Rhizobiaceae bacterium]